MVMLYKYGLPPQKHPQKVYLLADFKINDLWLKFYPQNSLMEIIGIAKFLSIFFIFAALFLQKQGD